MINKINNTTNKAKPPAKPQPPQLPPKPIIVPPLNKREKTKDHSCVLTDSIYFMFDAWMWAGPFENKKRHLEVPSVPFISLIFVSVKFFY